MSAFLSVDVDVCRARNHRFIVAGSDKTSLKRSLICLTCSGQGKTAYAAYGDETKSWGQWIQRKREKEEEPA